MADAVIGSLRVILGADTAAFSTGLKNAETALQKFGRQVGTIAAGVSLERFAERAGQALGHLVKGGIEAADQMGKMAQKVGIPTETLSGLKFAADLADVSFEQLGKGLAKLSKSILDGAINPSGEAGQAFQALGISARDSAGNIKSADAVFLDVAAKFSTMENGAAKTALAIKLFGRAGADLIPLLNAGATGIRALQEEARKLGIVISADTAAKAEQFNDTLKRIGTTSDAIGLRIAEALLPTLQRLANIFLEMSQQRGSLEGFFSNIVTELDIRNVQRIVLGFENLGRIISALRTFFQSLTGTAAQISAALDGLSKAVEENQRRVDALQRSWLSLGTAGAFDSLENLPELIARVGRGVGKLDESVLHTKDSFEKFIDSAKRGADATMVQAAGLHALVGDMEAARFVTEAHNRATELGIKLTAAQKAAIDGVAESIRQSTIAMAGSQLTISNMTPLEQYQSQLEKINQLLAQQAISHETAARASLKAANAMIEAYGGFAATAAGNFATFFTEFGKGNAKMFAVAKAFSIAQAIISTFVAANKALEAGPILGPILMASTIALGLANVAKILAQKPTAAALGGSFKVPGGVSGFDSKLVPMMLSPGERVDVTPASRVGEGSRELIIPSIKPKDFFTGETVREMVMAIDQWMKDGGTGIRLAT